MEPTFHRGDHFKKGRLPHGLQTGTRTDPRLRRGSRQGLLLGEGGLQPGCRPQRGRQVSGRAADAARLGLLDLPGHWDHGCRPGLGPRHAPGRLRHRGRARRARGTRPRGQRDQAHDVGWLDARGGSRTHRLQLLRRLQRPGRQQLGSARTPRKVTPRPADRTQETIAAAIAGDESAFAALSERHRRELHVHCYRMLASFDEAEDAVQETFLRAWRGRDSFDGSSQFRAWLYRIATNICLDMLRRSSRRLTRMHSFAEVPWLQPYPDRLLDEVAPSDDQPDAVAVERETLELVFLSALQVLA